MGDKDNNQWVTCAECGNRYRNHRVLHEKVKHYAEDIVGEPLYDEYHCLVECMGCETIKYVTFKVYAEDFDGEHRELKVYPEATANAMQRPWRVNPEDANELLPESVFRMYKETVSALNANIRTLAGGGLRAIVEAICLDKGIVIGVLQGKIDELANRNLLTKAQAELLHEERYLGNAALHEIATPSPQDIEDGLGIIEGLINTIYVLPSKAGASRSVVRKRRGRREKRNKSRRHLGRAHWSKNRPPALMSGRNGATWATIRS